MKNIIVSAPGKIHFLGEHAVVYGKAALLAAIDKRISVAISATKEKKVDDLSLEELKKVIEQAIKRKYKISKIPPYSISISSDIPIGCGLGSSAALSAALTFALLISLGVDADKTTVFDIAYKGESLFHGNPSGGDLATVIEGGLLWYRKEFEFLKTFSPLPFKLHRNIKQFILIDSGRPRETTREMVESVSEFKNKYPKIVEKIFSNQEELTKKMVIALKNGDEDLLIECIKSGQRNLERLRVVGVSAKKIISSIEKLGGAGKIMGGGGYMAGSGMLLAYHNDRKMIQKMLGEMRLQWSDVLLGEQGLRKEKS